MSSTQPVTSPPCLFAQSLEQANSIPDFFRIYSEELQKQGYLLEASFVRSYAYQREYFRPHAKKEHSRLLKIASDIDPNLNVSICSRIKAVASAINKGRKYLHRQDAVLDVYAYRVVLWGNFSEQEQVSFCYRALNKIVMHYLELGYVPCRSSKPSDTLPKESEEYKSLCTPSDSDLESISWLTPDSYKDYIQNPKKNLYQSLHLALRAPNGFVFELQIRTLQMDMMASEGDSEQDHDKYKSRKYKDVVCFDPLKVHIPGFIALEEPLSGKIIIRDAIGLTQPLPIILALV